jgi:hypothetical protein
MTVDVDLVREDPHMQNVGARIAKAGLEPNGQQDEGHVRVEACEQVRRLDAGDGLLQSGPGCGQRLCELAAFLRAGGCAELGAQVSYLAAQVGSRGDGRGQVGGGHG